MIYYLENSRINIGFKRKIKEKTEWIIIWRKGGFEVIGREVQGCSLDGSQREIYLGILIDTELICIIYYKDKNNGSFNGFEQMMITTMKSSPNYLFRSGISTKIVPLKFTEFEKHMSYALTCFPSRSLRIKDVLKSNNKLIFDITG